MPVAAVALAVAALVSQPNLAKLVLNPSAVGPGYVLVQRSDGKGTAQRTLDLCGTKNYASENLRSGRLQVDYVKQTKTTLALSNEVVTYKDGGAAQAMREVTQHAKTCPSKPIAFEGQPPLRYTITRIVDSKLLRGSIALRIDVSGKINGKPAHATRFAIYQRLGNVLSGVYSYAVNSVSAAKQERFALHAAEASATILRQGGQGGGLPA
ncbi:MAG TPA: hypothetical protein VFW41_04280 [Gaiellaceae bacterium]|nr:hypothetical protein [Gaiellaceae bacterium]